jgi:hypothetical protein
MLLLLACGTINGEARRREERKNTVGKKRKSVKVKGARV